MQNNSKYRRCPECNELGVEFTQLNFGTHCIYCKSLIEVELKYSLAASAGLCALCVVFFDSPFKVLGWVTLFILLVFSSNYRYWTNRYFPLRCYG